MTNHRALFFFAFLTVVCTQKIRAQASLPDITVKSYGERIVVSWKNDYAKPISNISIQRSFDSLRNFSTIGTVLNPQNLENGYADDKAPYEKMYYRVFISFEGGNYAFSKIHRPEKILAAHDSLTENNYGIRYFWQLDPDTGEFGNNSIRTVTATNPSDTLAIPVKPAPEVISYPSKRIYSVRESSVVLYLPEAPEHKYHVKFFDENNRMVFELTKLKEEYLILEKFNFMHSGWFHFELFDDGKLIEENRFFLGKDPKTNISFPRSGSR
jgi:hypothetical protein